MSRHATSERPRVPQEVEPVPNAIMLDDISRTTKRFRADEAGTASMLSHHKLSLLSGDSFRQGDECMIARGTTTASAERFFLASSNTNLGRLRGVDGGIPCNWKRKRDVEHSCDAFSEAGRSTLNITLARFTPVDRLESDVLLRAYSDIVFCGLFFSPFPLD